MCKNGTQESSQNWGKTILAILNKMDWLGLIEKVGFEEGKENPVKLPGREEFPWRK